MNARTAWSTRGSSAPKPNSACAESVEMAAAFPSTWYNYLAVAVQHILKEMKLETGVFMVRCPGQLSSTSW